MSKVVISISMSLDGFIAGSNDRDVVSVLLKGSKHEKGLMLMLYPMCMY